MSEPTEDIVDFTGRKIGDYEMMARIGIGGMGVVYEGKHPLIGKRVAVKFLLPSLSKDKELVARFVSEARAVNAIGHRGIVDIFNFGVTEDGTQYFVMEFLEGRAFDQVISKEAPMHPAMVMRYLEEILDALRAAHDAGVIHRDIKPSNIFLVESARARPYVKLLDFGIAKTNATKTGSTPQTRQSVVIGTPEYIAPEQAQGRSVSAATDLYAIGCMAFEMLTGQQPFRGENPLDTMFKHVVEPTPHAKSLVPNVPPVLDELVWKLMQKRPEDRPPSAGAVLKDIELLRGGLTVDAAAIGLQGPRPIPLTQESAALPFAPTVSTAEALKAVRRPRPMLALAVGALVVLAAGATAFALFRTGPAQQPTGVGTPPPPPPKNEELTAAHVDAGASTQVDAGTPAAVAVSSPDAGSPFAVGTKPAVTPAKRGISAIQLKGRIAVLEHRLEQREASRGEAMPTLRALLRQGKDDATKAGSEAQRREVWLMLDDVAKELDR